VEALAERFGVTLQTVRRDVRCWPRPACWRAFTAACACRPSTTENIAYRQRQQLNEPAKQRIARAVAARRCPRAAR
jgi:DeoR family glycerol-3-phosphate regulon repressor